MPEEIDFALGLARDAGRLLLGFHRRGLRADHIRAKNGHYDLVTAADVAAERLICAAIERRFPAHAFYGEESATGVPPDKGLAWVVDPIDGTGNFAHAMPLYAVNIALTEDGVPIAAVTHLPALGATYWAVKGGGAWQRMGNGRDRAISVSTAATLDHAILATGFAYARYTDPDHNVAEFLTLDRMTQSVRRLGTAAIGLAWVAAGMLEGYWEAGLKPWDFAAGWLLIEEAGGRLTRYDGSPMTLPTPNLLATNARAGIHDEVLRTFSSLRTPGV